MNTSSSHTSSRCQAFRTSIRQRNPCRPKRVFIDGTHTFLSGLRTGIQRVVRSLVREGVQIGREKQQSIQGVVLGLQGFERFSPTADSAVPSPPAALRDNILYFVPPAYTRAAEWLCRGVKSRKIRSFFLPQPGHLGIFKPGVRLVEKAQKLFGRKRRSDKELQLGDGDLLIMADAYWSKPEIWEHVAAARSRGAFIVVVLHDLIPFTHPQFVPPKFIHAFRQFLLQAVGNADFLVAVSQTVRDELCAKLPALLPELSSIPPIDAFRNGADFTDHAGPVRSELTQLFSGGQQSSPYLTVSTFDPRKNHAFTFAAFEHLWSRGSDAGLLFVGAHGWMCDDLLKKIRAHAQFGKKLNVFHDLSDTELSYCYQRARGAIASSLIEGFGLTIVESLWHGRKTFASDTPIHREVGGRHATFFGPDSPINLARAIEAWEAEIAAGADIVQSSVKPMSWRESTELLLERCNQGYQASLADVIPMRQMELHPSKTLTSAPKVA